MIIARAHVEADGAGNPVFLRIVHQEVGDTNAIEDLVGRFLGRLRHDRFIRLAMDHDLPSPLAQIGARFRVSHDRQAPFLELVNRGIHVTGHVKQQILTHQAH